MAMTDEEIAEDGLNVAGYPGKWARAKVLAEQNERTDDNRLLPYWERVRLLFLELGGQYLNPKVRS